MNRIVTACVLGALPMAPAAAATITFDDLAVGTVLSTQYQGRGVTFTPNAFTGPNTNTTSQPWATNTSLTIGTAADAGGSAVPAGAGNIVRTYSGWLSENGDASFGINFASAMKTVSLDLYSVASTSASQMFFYNGDTLLHTATATMSGVNTLSYTAEGAGITRVAVAPGTYFDYVPVDNLVFDPFPKVTTITFDDLAVGTVLSTQYQEQGVTFTPNAFTGPNTNTTSQPWATNTSLTIGTAADAGGSAVPAGAGNIVRTYSGWLSENGDASFGISFRDIVYSVSLDLYSVASTSASQIFFYNGDTLLHTATATTSGVNTLSYTATGGITRIAVAPGTYFDYVPVDNLVFSNFLPAAAGVPEPATWATMVGGFAMVAGAARRRRRRAALA